MASALDVARQLVFLGAAEDEPEFLTPARLQKLLYYCQAWHLAGQGRPLFPERIEAWGSGPVVPSIFEALRPWGHRPIEPQDIDAPESLNPEEVEHIIEVWQAYRGFSATRLRELTLGERPWRQARNGAGPLDASGAEITPEAMREFFVPLLATPT